MARGIVGDAFMHKSSVGDILRHKVKMHEARTQGISGNKYTKDRDMGPMIVLVNSLRRDIKIQQDFIQQNKSMVKLKLGAKEEAIKAIQREAERFKESLVLFNDGDVTKSATPFLMECRQHMKMIEQAGNSKVGNSYIFGGTITNIPPFDLSKVVDGIDPFSGANIDYYNGNSITTPIAIDTNDNLDSDLLGSHPAFENLIRALKIINDPSIKASDDRAKQAQNLVDRAIDELSGLISQVGAETERIDNLIEAREDYLLFVSEKHDEMVGADQFEVMSKFMEYQNSLTLAYETMASFSEMSLANFLK
jgi:flagellin-like hook-associated protein FlgL